MISDHILKLQNILESIKHNVDDQFTLTPKSFTLHGEVRSLIYTAKHTLQQLENDIYQPMQKSFIPYIPEPKPTIQTCTKHTPPGFLPCTREADHDGPCAHWSEMEDNCNFGVCTNCGCDMETDVGCQHCDECD